MEGRLSINSGTRPKCTVCNSSDLIRKKTYQGYDMCPRCGIYWNFTASQTEMLNDTEKISLPHQILIHEIYAKFQKVGDLGVVCDFGCGKGYLLKLLIKRGVTAFGIEITDESRIFAEAMSLQVFKTPTADMNVDTVTFLHSFEHLTPDALISVLTWINEGDAHRILISVPNANSIGYKIFGGLNAFHDPINHPVIYSQQGLDRVFQNFGFTRKSTYQIWSYTFFGVVQTMLNAVFRSRNEFYLRLKRGKKSFNGFHFLFSLFIIFILTPLVLPVLVILLFNRKLDFVINCEYTRVI